MPKVWTRLPWAMAYLRVPFGPSSGSRAVTVAMVAPTVSGPSLSTVTYSSSGNSGALSFSSTMWTEMVVEVWRRENSDDRSVRGVQNLMGGPELSKGSRPSEEQTNSSDMDRGPGAPRWIHRSRFWFWFCCALSATSGGKRERGHEHERESAWRSVLINNSFTELEFQENNEV
ncbi:hypothetical protein EYF80_063205 [Liparis tanakae]|uniref:Uncharacterized protein n=1 Tax=Liparis tanakae TaxID=230148 RepID=A0A4Z2EDM5_9TELE|nr:hypothetical protein EYF80_063205 [Liparis tanakae]